MRPGVFWELCSGKSNLFIQMHETNNYAGRFHLYSYKFPVTQGRGWVFTHKGSGGGLAPCPDP